MQPTTPTACCIVLELSLGTKIPAKVKSECSVSDMKHENT
jgi:hypothetical protein